LKNHNASHYIIFEEREKQSPTLFDSASDGEQIRRDGISDFIFEQAREFMVKCNQGRSFLLCLWFPTFL